MAVVDDRGRIAGRVNVIDALVAILLVLVIPMAYGAYLLFRTPQPKLTAVAPATLYEGPNQRVGIGGRNLRPFMRVSFNDVQGRTFMIASTTNAAIDLPDLGPGSYDVVLYDQMEEVDRLKKALTILPLAPAPTIDVEVSGAFLYLSEREPMKVGQKFPPDAQTPAAEVISVGAPVPAGLRIRAGELNVPVKLPGQIELPATLHLRCYLTVSSDGTMRCHFQGPTQPLDVAPDSTLTLQGPKGWVNFQIADVHPTDKLPIVRVVAQFNVAEEIARRMQPGDLDVSPRVNAEGLHARIVSVARQGAAVIATLDVPAEQAAGGWLYKREPLKLGAPLSFETLQYIARGTVTMMTPQAASGAAAQP
ncbi:MAG TPA: hypothetical protein VKE96_27785 [Vicinamibacterales bacterium]|nr:hypothetical protein [Vicinamibacterales bacterium]